MAASAPKTTRSLRTRTASRMPFVALDESVATPLYEQIYVGIREHIIGGRLTPGSKLASSRQMAIELGVSRFTIVAAFDALLSEGYVVASPRGGTYVSKALPDLSLRSRATIPPRGGRPAPRPSPNVETRLSLRGRAISGVTITGPRYSENEARPFHPRRPPLDIFPTAEWARLVRRQWQGHRHQMLDYGEPNGYRGLRQAIADHAASTRGVVASVDQVIITSGAQQAFNLIFQLLLNAGDDVWIEEPGYLDARAAMTAWGARIHPVPVDAEGLNVGVGIATASDARLAYVSPSHQYPTGATMSASRRLALLQWAHDSNAWIVEDDYDSYFRYRGRPLPALQRLESDWLSARSDAPAAARVLYVGTFSKTMFPSLRLGYCVVPPELAPVFANARAIADRNSPIADQAALEILIDEGHYDRHLRRIRAACLERYEAMMHAARRHLAGVVSLAPMNAGTHVMGTLSPGYPAAPRLEELAREEGIVLFPLSRYCIRRPARDAIILGYGGLTPRAIDTGVRRLASILETHRDSGRSRRS